jgi:large subunit ribosomal protein L23
LDKDFQNKNYSMGILEKWSKKKEKEQLGAVTSTPLDIEKISETKTKTKKSSESTKKGLTGKSALAYKVIRKPLISEKAGMAEVHGSYIFVVRNEANKTQIKQAIKELYGVMPSKVATMQMEGKRVRFGYTQGRRSDWKKAIVTLPKGHTIDIHEGV